MTEAMQHIENETLSVRVVRRIAARHGLRLGFPSSVPLRAEPSENPQLLHRHSDAVCSKRSGQFLEVPVDRVARGLGQRLQTVQENDGAVPPYKTHLQKVGGGVKCVLSLR